MSIKDKVNAAAGAVQEAGGKIRQKVDEAVGDHKGAAYGVKDQVEGNLRKNTAKLSDALD